LIEAAEAHARACGAPSLRVRVDVDNPGARRLYRRLGFRPRVLLLMKPLAGEPPTGAGGAGRGAAAGRRPRRRGR
jgi:hypothetical protein